ncbi:hypothetical protein BX600DRAFT_505162 [Xylariales sp. PMI_506]|nr:hypothetical protein BX600DRAFT_505162 [Xylariales sp. PMI_506]
MAVLSLIKRGRQQAKEHNQKQAEKAKNEAVQLQYTHVPTHAAADALTGTPSSWQQDYRPRILEQNRRRAAMAALGTNPAVVSRTGSSLSYVSYPSTYNSSAFTIPKSYSYNSFTGMATDWHENLAADYSRRRGSSQSENGSTREPSLASFLSVDTNPLTSPRKNIKVQVDTAGVRGDPGIEVIQNGLPIEGMSQRSITPQHLNVEAKRSGMTYQAWGQNELGHRPHSASQHNTRRNSDRYYPPSSRSSYFTTSRTTNSKASESTLSDPLASPATSVPPSRFSSAATSAAASQPASATSSTATIGLDNSTEQSSIASAPNRDVPLPLDYNIKTLPKAHGIAQVYSAKNKGRNNNSTMAEISLEKTTTTPEILPSVIRRPKVTRFVEVDTISFSDDRLVEVDPVLRELDATMTIATIKSPHQGIILPSNAAYGNPPQRLTKKLSKTPPVEKPPQHGRKRRWSFRAGRVNSITTT